MPPWFANLPPEGALREIVARAAGVAPEQEAALLHWLAADLPGAVRLSPDAPDDDDDALEVDPERVAGPPVDPPNRPFSLSGLQLKMSMVDRAGRLTAPASGEGGDWIVKFPDRLYPGVPANEHATMVWARLAGVDVPQVRLVGPSELPDVREPMWARKEEALAVRRFDRPSPGARRHMEDLAQVRQLFPRDKYTGNFETVAAIAYRGHDTGSLEQFLRRMVFNVACGNGDAHLKNWTLLYVDPKVPQLSPAYDLVATFVYAESGGREEDLGLKLGGSRRFEAVSAGALRRLAHKIGADPEWTDEVVADAVERTLAAWEVLDDRAGYDTATRVAVGRCLAQLSLFR